jgi:hypothetical protein
VSRADLDAACIHPVRRLTPGSAAMTLGRHVLIRRERLGDAALLHHELVHVRQWREQGVVGFLARYLAAYLRGRAAGMGHWDAYRAIPAEAEAREAAGR